MRANALVAEYSSEDDFRRQVTRQLSLAVRELVAKDAVSTLAPVDAELTMEFVWWVKGNAIAIPRPVEIERPVCFDKQKIPDYVDPSSVTPKSSLGGLQFSTANFFSYPPANSDYYRQLIDYFEIAKSSIPIAIALSNDAENAAQNVFLDLRLSGSSQYGLTSAAPSPPTSTSSFMSTGIMNEPLRAHALNLKASPGSTDWSLETEFAVIQSGRKVVTSNPVYLRAESSVLIDGVATVFSNAGPPFALTDSIDINVVDRKMSYREILMQLEVDDPALGA
jgi:hypothetical protein